MGCLVILLLLVALVLCVPKIAGKLIDKDMPDLRNTRPPRMPRERN